MSPGPSAALVAAVTAVLAAPTASTDYYVDPAAGRDLNGGTSPGAAFATLGRAVSAANRNGDIVHAAAGDYDLSAGSLDLSEAGGVSITGPSTGGARLLGGAVRSHRALDPAMDSAVWGLIAATARATVRVADLTDLHGSLGKTAALSSVDGEVEEFLQGGTVADLPYVVHPRPPLTPLPPCLSHVLLARSRRPSPVPPSSSSAASAFGAAGGRRMEPFLDGRPLVPAQWPNRVDPDDAYAANITDFVWSRVYGTEDNSATLVSTSGFFKRWRFPVDPDAPFEGWTDWDDVVAQGFWTVDW